MSGASPRQTSFEVSREVLPADIDELGHVSNYKAPAVLGDVVRLQTDPRTHRPRRVSPELRALCSAGVEEPANRLPGGAP